MNATQLTSSNGLTTRQYMVSLATKAVKTYPWVSVGIATVLGRLSCSYNIV